MPPTDVIEIPSSDEHDDEHDNDAGPSPTERRTLLTPIITRVVAALGGYEDTLYALGDDVRGCLRDLKRLWRKDDVDDDRTVARIFYETRLLPNDLIPILLQTAGRGLVTDKRAIGCVDLMTAMTWPIDVAEELKELDEELDRAADYTQLIAAHLAYKACLLKPGVMKALFAIMLPPLAKTVKEREERDAQVMSVVLHLIRNLAFIKDPPANSLASSERQEQSGLQSKLIRVLEETHILKLLLTIAANTDNDPLFNNWNTLVLEIFYLLFRGAKPESISQDQAKEPTANLQRLLALEDRTRRDVARKASSRHSRFGTTISVRLNPNKGSSHPSSSSTNPSSSTTPSTTNDGDRRASGSKQFVLHRQAAIHAETASIMDMSKRQRARKAATVDAVGQDHNLSVEARVVLKGVAGEFLEGCFNPFLAGLLKDIRSERAKITEKDNLRLLFVTKWFLEYFLTMQAKESAASASKTKDAAKTRTDGGEEEVKWEFGLIAEVTERVWIVWVLKRMREAMEEKPKAWTELQAGIECLTQLLLLIERLSSTTSDPSLAEAAEVLQQQLVYNGEVLDIALESLRTYKEGTQSLVYLDASVHLAYVLLRGLERWARERGDGTYVRRRMARRRKKKGVTEEEGIPDVEEEPVEVEEDVVQETLFTFEAFEAKFANADVASTLLTYLGRYKEFGSGEQMKRVVGLMHRQAVKAKAEGLFFKVSTLDMFKSILADQKALPREQPYKDLVSLINFILRKFFKALEAEPFLAIETFLAPRANCLSVCVVIYLSNDRPPIYLSISAVIRILPEESGALETVFELGGRGERQRRWGQGGGAGGGRGSRGGAASNPNAQEVVVKKGYSWTDQMGIAIAALVDAGKKSLVTWTQELLKSVVDKRNRIVEETDQKSDGEDEDDNDDAMRLKGPSADAISKFEDEVIPYLSNDHAEAASKNVHLKLLFRLCKFFLRDEDADEDDELEWYIPQAILPSELEQCCNVIAQFLESPFELGGKKASELMQKKRRRRTRRQRSASASGDEGDGALSDAPARRQKRKKKEKEQVQYKSAQFIEDSDEEYGDMEAFMERERVQREKAQLAAALGGDTSKPLGMKAKGTKKRRKRKGKGKGADADADAGREGEGGDGGSGGAAAESSRPASRNGNADSGEEARGSGLGDGEDEEGSDGGSAPDPHASAKSSDVEDGDAPGDVDDTPVSRPRPKPRPRPVPRKRKASRSPGRDDAGRGRARSVLEEDDQSGGSSPPRSEAVEEPELAVSERGSPNGSEDGGEAVRTARRAKRLVLSDSDEE
ncbi:hypothetical protein D9611_011155 [Ephemerocybe angulata]|uniref:Timeless N-terminal domain-containing protein n=1 Tax=Ephemerocybe angulata TaxID=980116 RepID=A0A8H5FJI6_9AGAR|nr:hypothetical protein D9611_011155 [Tulosesus angulatus]